MLRSLALLVVTLLAPFVVAQQAQLVLQGRFGGSVDEQTGLGSTPLLFSWPASSVSTSFLGSGISATLSALPPTVTYNSFSRFVFYIDGAQVATEMTSPNATTLTWSANNLSTGKCICLIAMHAVKSATDLDLQVSTI